MPSFGRRSRTVLSGAYSDLQEVLNHAIKHVDFSVICSKRNKEDQDQSVINGKSRAWFGQSPHNWTLEGGSLAVDIVPYPIPPWNSDKPEDIAETIRRFEEVIFVIKIVASTLDIDITFGKDFIFKDFPHIEMTGWASMKEDLVK